MIINSTNNNKSNEHKKTTTYDIEKSCTGMGQAHEKCGGVSYLEKFYFLYLTFFGAPVLLLKHYIVLLGFVGEFVMLLEI